MNNMSGAPSGSGVRGMNDMFGAPIGIGAAEQDMRQSVLGGLQAQKLLGEIAEHPDHAQLARAQAGKAQEEASDARKLAELSAAAAARGRIATVDDLEANGPRSGADYLERLAELAAEKGVSPKATADLYTKAAGIRQKEAAAASARATEQVRGLDAGMKRAERLGALATMGLQGPQQYAQMRMMAVQEGLPVDRLPQDFNAARPLLQGVVASSMSAKDTLEAKRKEIHDAAQRTRWNSSNARDAAAVKLAEKREVLIEERTKQLVKNGGSGSPEAKKAAEEMAATRRAIREAKVRKEFPPAPLDPSARQPGRTYTAADGKTRFIWDRDPQSGKYVAVVLGGVDYGSVGAGVDEDADLLDEGEE